MLKFTVYLAGEWMCDKTWLIPNNPEYSDMNLTSISDGIYDTYIEQSHTVDFTYDN